MSNVLPLYRAAAPPAPVPPYPTSCKGTIAFGCAIIALVFGGFGTWASLAPLSSAAIAPGTVVVDSSRKSLQHLEGGVIRDILVRDGDVVDAGQTLLRLDGANVRAAMASLHPMLATNQAYQRAWRLSGTGTTRSPSRANSLRRRRRTSRRPRSSPGSSASSRPGATPWSERRR